ncbi:6055_t:CDS:2 [Ambispora gerdemannii]|uniref:6055_t:CDS:1 n=1 Tax=Ambispora gerdemannii TaxID=144530 RepID=A0A9N9FE81_9GLOM|nr:6055_t:CDS:2 [Ambispora gerdemannii]
MSYLTRDQLDSYLKNLSTKATAAKPVNLSQPKSPVIVVPPNTPLSPLSPNRESSNNNNNSSTDSNNIPEPDSLSLGNNRNDPSGILSFESTSSKEKPVASTDFDSSNKSNLNSKGLSFKPLSSASLSVSKEKKYQTIDDIVNDLAYPMQTKLAFTPLPKNNKNDTPDIVFPSETTRDPANTWKDDNTSTTPPKIKGESKGAYVLSAAFKSYGTASRSPSTNRSISPTIPTSKKRDSFSSSKSNSPPLPPTSNATTISLLQNDLDKLGQKYPPIENLENPVSPELNSKEVKLKFPKIEEFENQDLNPKEVEQHFSSIEEDREMTKRFPAIEELEKNDQQKSNEPLSAQPRSKSEDPIIRFRAILDAEKENEDTQPLLSDKRNSMNSEIEETGSLPDSSYASEVEETRKLPLDLLASEKSKDEGNEEQSKNEGNEEQFKNEGNEEQFKNERNEEQFKNEGNEENSSQVEDANSRQPPLNNAGIETPNKISEVCARCGKRISGSILTAMGRQWHPEHFGCKKCGIPLEHVAFFEKDGDPYCHLDYHELFSPRCGYCHTPIEGDCIKALGKSWHNGHFFCRECGEPFADGGFMVNDGFPYCKKDWVKNFASKCKGCTEPINGEYVNALKGMWHRDCFVCTACEKPFNSSFFYVHNDKPYCDSHYRQILALASDKAI